MNNLAGLSTINIELTSRCNANCWMCGRRKLEKEHKEICNWGDMTMWDVKSIASQIYEMNNITIQFHSNGEPLLYENLGQAIDCFKKQIKCLNTNGKLLIEKANELIDNLDTLTISVIENDPEGDEQFEIVKKFLEIKGNQKPFMVYRLLGNVKNVERWYRLPGIVATRILHSPMGSFNYTKKVTIPETGICQDLLNHLVVDRFGDVFPCVRFDYNKYNLLGNIHETSLIKLWNSPKRLSLIKEHVKGNRNCSELCSKCSYYGCPTPNDA